MPVKIYEDIHEAFESPEQYCAVKGSEIGTDLIDYTILDTRACVDELIFVECFNLESLEIIMAGIQPVQIEM